MFPCSANLPLTTETNVLRTVSIILEKDENKISSWSETKHDVILRRLCRVTWTSCRRTSGRRWRR